MLRPRWHKVFHDLFDNKVRTFLVILSIFIGVFSVGVTIAMYVIIGEDLNASWFSTNPAQAYLYTSPFPSEFLETVIRLPNIAEAEGRESLSVRLKIGPDEWLPLYLTALPDYVGQRINLLKPESGVWPPRDHQLYLERSSLKFSRAKVGDRLEIQLSDGTIRNIPLAGTVFDMQAGTGSALGISGFVSFDTLEWLHAERMLSSLIFRVKDVPLNMESIQKVADQVSEHVRKSGYEIYYVYVPPPGQFPGYSQIMGVIAIIGALGFMSLFLAGFLIFNTLSALLVQHVRYIGVMKAIGARRAQIITMYLVLTMIFSVLALIPAIPLASYVASLVAIAMGKQFNYDSQGFRFVPAAVLVQVLVGLGISLLAGFLPIYTGTRISIHEALSTYGLGKGQFGKSLIDRVVEHVRGLSRPLLISIRNTFRRKGRIVLTLLTLAIGGAIFVAVFNLRASLVVFIEQIGKYFLSDVNVSFNQAYLMQEIENTVLPIPGVKSVEGWTGASGELLRLDGIGMDNVQIIAPPVNSQLIEPILLQGRWLVPGDQNAIVLNNAFWKSFPDLKVGDDIKLKINNKDTTWRIVGFFKFPGDTQLLGYTTYEYMSELLHAPNRAYTIRVVGEDHSPLAQEALSKLVKDTLQNRGFQVGYVQTSSMMVEANAQVINIIVGFFLFFAILVALVGAIGLMGTMSMNVMERTREIGVMRAIGANNWAIFRIVLVEGMMIGLISWALGGLLAFPISALLYNILSRALFQTEGKAVITQDGFLIWLIVAVFLSAIASFLPARSASRMTIRDVLAYE